MDLYARDLAEESPERQVFGSAGVGRVAASSHFWGIGRCRTSCSRRRDTNRLRVC